MANLSAITLATARSDLRARLAKITDQDYTDPELLQWLNLGQYGIANFLNGIGDQWYGSVEAAVDVSAQVVDTVNSFTLTGNLATSKVMRFKLVNGSAGAGIIGVIVPWKTLTEIFSMTKISFNTTERGVCHFGNTLLFYWGSGVTMALGAVDIYYLRKPTMMSADTDTVDVPDEYVNEVIKFAKGIALEKAGLISQKQQLDKELEDHFRNVRTQYMNEIQLQAIEGQPGIQTPRNN